MIHRTRPRRRRRGAVLVESTFAYVVILLLTLGTIVMGLGVFRYQELAWLAREGSQWAAVHGPTYQREQGAAAPTGGDVLTNAIAPRMVMLSPSALTCTLTMTNGTATVSLSYAWTPEAYFSPVTLRSTSASMITY